MQSLKDLFIAQLQDAYSAENQIIDALPDMIEAADSALLKAGFEQHLEETRHQVNRLEQVGKLVGCKLKGETCEAMEGLLEEGQEILDADAEESVRDAGLIAAAQKVEHYEMALYGCLCTWAKQLGLSDVQRLLHQTLEEEKRTDEKLTQLAESQVNLQAAHA
jgi:ferritin-like metal-binding protein YciE